MTHLASRISLPVALLVFATLWTITPQEFSEFLEQAYGCKNYTQELLRLVEAEAILKDGPVTLWKYSHPAEFAERIRS